MLYEEKRKEQEREIDFKHTFYVPYHVKANGEAIQETLCLSLIHI